MFDLRDCFPERKNRGIYASKIIETKTILNSGGIYYDNKMETDQRSDCCTDGFPSFSYYGFQQGRLHAS
jgi:hypothetical protein